MIIKEVKKIRNKQKFIYIDKKTDLEEGDSVIIIPLKDKDLIDLISNKIPNAP